MIEIVEVKTKKQQKDFLDFPLKLYKGNDCFVPPLYGDEKKMFRSDYVYYDTCEAACWNAYRDGKIVGRIQGILQKAHNEKTGEKRIRFTRFDAIQLSTFEEQYNADYYQRLIEHCGYGKEVDWEERKIYLPDQDDGTLEKMSRFIMDRYHLHFGPAKNKKDFIRRYGDAFFDLIDRGYKDIYGTVPFTKGMQDMLIQNFMLIIDLKYVGVVLDEQDKLVMLGLCFPSLSRALQKSNGKLTPAALVRVLRDVKKPKILDLGLVAVDPEWANRGVATIASAHILKLLRSEGVEYAETNLNLEDNRAIINQWKRFKAVQHKKRRSFVKKLEN